VRVPSLVDLNLHEHKVKLQLKSEKLRLILIQYCVHHIKSLLIFL